MDPSDEIEMSFTAHVLERARARQNAIMEGKQLEIPSFSPDIDSGSDEENDDRLLEAQTIQRNVSIISTTDEQAIGQRKPLKRLGELYSGAMISSPAHGHLHPESIASSLHTETSVEGGRGEAGRRARLNALAKKINGWEDDVTHHTSVTSRFNIGSKTPTQQGVSSASTAAHCFITPSRSNPTTPVTSMSPTTPKNHIQKTNEDTKKQMSPVRTIVRSPQKYISSSPVRTRESPQKQISPTRTPVGSPVRNVGGLPSSSPERRPSPTRVPSSKVLEKAALFEMNSTTTTLNGKSDEEPVDPSNLSVAQRAKLFERQAAVKNANCVIGGGLIKRKGQQNFKVPVQASCAGTSALSKDIDTKVTESVSLDQPAQSEAPMPRKKRLSVCNLPRGKVQNSKRLFESGAATPTAKTVQELDKLSENNAYLPSKQIYATEGRKNAESSKSREEVIHEESEEEMDLEDELSITFTALDQSKTIVQYASPSPPRQKSPEKNSTTPKRAASQSPQRQRSLSPGKQDYPGTCDAKRIRVNEPKLGHIYPSLTDVECTETEKEEDDDDSHTIVGSESSYCSSLGAQIVKLSQTKSPEKSNKGIEQSARRSRGFRPTEDFSTSVACREIDALIDEALEGQDDEMSENSTIAQSPLESSSPIFSKGRRQHEKSDYGGTPLVHTVSIFRKQQEVIKRTCETHVDNSDSEDGSQHSTSIVEREKQYEGGVSPDRRDRRIKEANARIISLTNEMEEQIRYIAQVSKALNLCKSTPEFHDSSENVECERILLVASQKRQALQNEIQRLKTDGVLTDLEFFSPTRKKLDPTSNGILSISEIGVTLRPDFLNTFMNGNTVHHFIILLKEGTQVEVSPLISIGPGHVSCHLQNGVLNFADVLTLRNLEHNFQAHLELYELKTQKEFLPHEAKYHIKNQKASSGILTPKKPKGDLTLSRGLPLSNPAGPNSILTSGFSICGRLSLDISKLSCRHFNLDGVRSSSPVHGSTSLKIHCQCSGGVVKTGWLTMFGDVQGMGVWTRAWFKLTANRLTYWTYPENAEADDEPLGEISLRQCVTTRVQPAKPEVCARANSFLLVTTRAPAPNDKTTLITSVHTYYTAIRHLLCADSREERDAWCTSINEALANLRAWDPAAMSPDDSLF